MKNKLPDYIFVAIQLLLFVLFLREPLLMHKVEPAALRILGVFLMVIGIAYITIALIQLNSKLSMLPTPVKSATLITTGIFKYVRHPIYSGIFLLTLGYSIVQKDLEKFIISVLILILFEIKSNYEEKKLTEKFPEYIKYKTVSSKFFPFHLVNFNK